MRATSASNSPPAGGGIMEPLELQDALRTEVEFVLPCGYVDETGTLHQDGVMRMSTALDEIQPLLDGRVRANHAYVSILLLSRVITRLGSISPVPPAVVERLFS